MKYLKQYQEINEEFNFKFVNKLKIKYLCRKYNIKNYTINDDVTIDVDDDVNLYEMNLIELPLNFGNVSGDFFCNKNKLMSLKGCPKSVGGDFNCHGNSYLTSLEGCPESVGGDFYCHGLFRGISAINSLEGGPKSVGGSFNCRYGEIRTLEGFPRHLGDDFYCDYNPVEKLWELFKDKDKVELFNDFGITDGDVVIIDRLNDFLEMIGKPILTDTKGLKEVGYEIV